MKFFNIVFSVGVAVPCVAFVADASEFQDAAKLLSAARTGNIQTVQQLINSGVDVNYTDSTGLSLVCTAMMNNDTKAMQILQMYGADSSNCDKQIKQYKNKIKLSTSGEEYSFFSGLSSAHVIALSAVGIAAVGGGAMLLTGLFDSDNNNSGSSSSGDRGSSGGSSSSSSKGFSVPGPTFYYTDDGATVSTSEYQSQYSTNLSLWEPSTGSTIRKLDFNYFKPTVDSSTNTNSFITDGLNSALQNYLLVMHGYSMFANNYMGQTTFRDSANRAVEILNGTGGGKPISVALVTGNGINPAGSADRSFGISYADSASASATTLIVDKYLNYSGYCTQGGTCSGAEKTGFDFSGSGTSLNPFASADDTALAKIVAGWESDARSVGDLYGFIPNGQLAIYRTGNGNQFVDISNATSGSSVGTFTDTNANGVLDSGDSIVIGGIEYDIVTALSLSPSVTNPTITINNTTYKLSAESSMLVGKCKNTSGCSNIAIYTGTDGYWYVNSSGGTNVDTVYTNNSGNIYIQKTTSTNVYSNFQTLLSAKSSGANVIANTNIIPNSRNESYLTTKLFTKAFALSDTTNVLTFFQNTIDSYYSNGVTQTGVTQGNYANTLFGSYNTSSPILVMPAGEYLFESSTGEQVLDTLDATFENYAPLLYGSNLNHNFMTIVAVNHSTGTSSASGIESYGDGTGSAYGTLYLSLWEDSAGNTYSSRKCGLAGSGTDSVDPWCFAASGPTAEMATASAAGAVASLISAFPYMTNTQIYTLLALTADGPYLKTNSSGTVFSDDDLVAYLKTKYSLPLEYNASSLTSTEYLQAFKDVYGYGLINLERAANPGHSIYYYDSTSGNILSTSGNAYWRSASNTLMNSSNVLSLNNNQSIKASFYDVLESIDGSISLPRIWTNEISLGNASKHGLYMGDVLGDFNVDSTNKRKHSIGNIELDMAISQRAYTDNMNGLDNLRVAFVTDDVNIAAEYQRYLTDGESRFSGRSNGILSLATEVISSDAMVKNGNFSFGGRAFSGSVTDESLLQTDPVISAEFKPKRLGLASGGMLNAIYDNQKFNMAVSVGVMYETNTVLGMYSTGLLALNGGNTQYIDATAEYNFDKDIKLFLRGTFANTQANVGGSMIASLSDIQSNAFAFGADIKGFSFTAAMPLTAVRGNLGYSYADYDVVENDGKYNLVINNPHTEYIDLGNKTREIRFSSSYKRPIGDFTDAGVGFIYRINPNNITEFGNESILMFKLHHRLGI